MSSFVNPYFVRVFLWVDYLVQCALIPFSKIDLFWPVWRTYAERAKRVSNLRYTTRATFFIICTFQIQRKVYPLTGFWPFRSERPFGFLTPFRCEAPPNGFLTVSQREAFWVFDIVLLRVRPFGFLTSFHEMRAFCVFEVFCSVQTITCVLDPYEHFIPF